MNEEAKKWYESLNPAEKAFSNFLEYAQLHIEPRQFSDGDGENEGKYWVVDSQNCWGNETVGNAQGVIEAHPSIIDEMIDGIEEDAEGLDFPEDIVGEDGLMHEPYEAGYWATLYWRRNELNLGNEEKEFLESYRGDIMVLDMVAFHSAEVDLEKFI